MHQARLPDTRFADNRHHLRATAVSKLLRTQQLLELIVAAEAEKRASLDRAEAVKTLATAEAESNKIKAVGVRNIGEAEAAIITLKNEAQNKLGANVIDFELAKKRIETMPSALAEMVNTELAAGDKLRLVDFDRPFHFAEKINVGAVHSRGEHLLFLNDDIEVGTPNWIERMRSVSRRMVV